MPRSILRGEGGFGAEALELVLAQHADAGATVGEVEADPEPYTMIWPNSRKPLPMPRPCYKQPDMPVLVPVQDRVKVVVGAVVVPLMDPQ